MIKTALEKLFAAAAPKRRAGTIIRRPAAGEYLLADDQGRQFGARSDQDWRPGDRVVVVAEIIVGRGAAAAIKTYQI